MAKKKKIDWKTGDVFVIPLKNGKYCVGHVLDQRMVNTIRIALYDEVLDQPDKSDVNDLCKVNKLI